MGFRDSRVAPRIRLDGFCSVMVDGRERHAVLLDLSANGVRVERPFEPAQNGKIVQLELELPGIDEVVWAKGEVCFARLSPLPRRPIDAERPEAEIEPRFVCRAGIRIAAVASRDRQLMRDYVIELRKKRRALRDRWLATRAA